MEGSRNLVAKYDNKLGQTSSRRGTSAEKLIVKWKEIDGPSSIDISCISGVLKVSKNAVVICRPDWVSHLRFMYDAETLYDECHYFNDMQYLRLNKYLTTVTSKCLRVIIFCKDERRIRNDML